MEQLLALLLTSEHTTKSVSALGVVLAIMIVNFIIIPLVKLFKFLLTAYTQLTQRHNKKVSELKQQLSAKDKRIVSRFNNIALKLHRRILKLEKEIQVIKQNKNRK